MEAGIRAVLTALLLPPANLAVLALLAVLLAGRRRWGRAVAAAACALLVLLGMPVVSLSLLASLDPGSEPAGTPAAIVILGGDVQRAPGPHGAVLGTLSLERVRAGAAMHRSTGLPILTSGGLVDGVGPVGAMMADSLRDDFNTPARWIEPVSFDTWENARFSAALLRREGVEAVYVVTHAWHMRRALLSFRRAGLPAVPAPVRRDRWPDLAASEFVPRASAWAQSYNALHEWLGLLWYSVRS